MRRNDGQLSRYFVRFTMIFSNIIFLGGRERSRDDPCVTTGRHVYMVQGGGGGAKQQEGPNTAHMESWTTQLGYTMFGLSKAKKRETKAKRKQREGKKKETLTCMPKSLPRRV